MIPRTVYPHLQHLYKKPDILALVGSRRVGKTTLMEMLYVGESKKKVFLSFDDQKTLRLFEDDIDAFAKVHVVPNDVIFIDEFQYAKSGGQLLKYLYDTFKKKIVISGSSTPELTINSLSYLVGRVFVVPIYPLSFDEFLGYKDSSLVSVLKDKVSSSTLELIQPHFEEYVLYGGYPQVVLEDSLEDKKERLNQIVNTYLLKEIRDILQYKDSGLFYKLLKTIALESGGMINKHTISSVLDISFVKLNEMLDVLEKTFVIQKLHPYANKKIKELVKSPKFYVADNGFRNMLLDDFRPLSTRVDKGVLYENFLLQSLRDESLFFYNYKNSSEVDFLIEKPEGLIAIEAKSYLPKPKLSRGLHEFISKYSPIKVIVFNESIFEIAEVNGVSVDFKHYVSRLS